jgi:hypothetical protein
MAVTREQPSRLCDTITGLFNRQCELFDEHLEEKSLVEIYEKILSLLNVPENMVFMYHQLFLLMVLKRT